MLASGAAIRLTTETSLSPEMAKCAVEPAKPCEARSSCKQGSTGALTAVPEAMARLALVCRSFSGSGRAGSADPLFAAAAGRKLGLAHLRRGRFDRLAGTVLCGPRRAGPKYRQAYRAASKNNVVMCS